ncbi:MAG: HipA domain-containing protein [Oligoflexus sp.]|nr:HipA domain-containing protein [Oligoflexus sp.]
MNDRILNAKRAQVSVDGKTVGYLEKIASDEYRFAYDKTYLASPDAIPLSLSLPIQNMPVVTEELPPFFDNLLMEGRALRQMNREHGLDARTKSDRFKLLLLSAKDTTGAVTIQALDEGGNVLPDETLPSEDPTAIVYETMHSAYAGHCPVCLKPGSIHPRCSTQLINSQMTMKIAVNEFDRQSTFRRLPLGASISGAQDKSLFKVTRGIFRPELPSTHILKPEGDYTEMPANEHLTMTIARNNRFNVPATGLFRVDGLGLIYVIKRFDRRVSGERILLEDFAQILKYMESDKEDGSMEEIATAIDTYASSPAIEKSDYFRRILFSFVFGNGDMHLKNWSMIYDSSSKLYKLSPVYDWLNVRASMPSEKVEMILPLGEQRTDFSRSDFEKFGLDILRLNKFIVQKTFLEVPTWVSKAKSLCAVSALSDAMKVRYIQIVEERSQRL